MRKFDVDLGSIEYSVQIADNIFSKLDDYLLQTNLTGDLVFIVDEFILEKYFPRNASIRKKTGYFLYVLPVRKNNKSCYTAL